MSPARRDLLLPALAAAAVALLFALVTGHVWEDYYITYRSSRHLATGQGLVFNPGDRLHTFTSPLGVLLPAAASLLTFNRSDDAALWIFRLLSCVALGGAAALLAHLARQRQYAPLAGLLVLGWIGLDAKTVDFSINGMETAFLVLFLAYALWAHLVPTRRPWLHLGCAWAGLMWTRPDSFVYIGLIAAGFWLFNEPERTGATRRQLLRTFLQAGLVTTALYLPWFLFAWGYYGSPVPHTIVAKSGIGDPRTLAGLLQTVLHLPFASWSGTGSLEGTFLPAYYVMGGWPPYVVLVGGALAGVAALLWLLPFLRVETRAASFAFFGAHAYLSYYPYFPFPWYLPGTTVLAVFALGSLLAGILDAARAWPAGGARPRQVRRCLTVLVVLTLAGNGWLTGESARLFRAQQQLVEDRGRRQIGEWLRAHAAPGDTVFLEPLGYIGYFSGLKTYDFPGMSSREVVAARRRVGVSWAKLIEELAPTWVVLRPHEAKRIANESYDLLSTVYAPVREFSVADEVAALRVRGQPYLAHDARFVVYKQAALPEVDTSPFAITPTEIDGVKVTFAHAPSTLVRTVPAAARHAAVQFGFIAGAYAEGADRTDGATFSLKLIEGARVTVLAERTLEPATNPADRGLQRFECALPPRRGPARLHLVVHARGSTTKDWTCWGELEFR